MQEWNINITCGWFEFSSNEMQWTQNTLNGHLTKIKLYLNQYIIYKWQFNCIFFLCVFCCIIIRLQFFFSFLLLSTHFSFEYMYIWWDVWFDIKLFVSAPVIHMSLHVFWQQVCWWPPKEITFRSLQKDKLLCITSIIPQNW